MPWVRLDEEFPDHPKVVTAGPLAAWLHVCALAYCNRYLTDGFVPEAKVRRLADFDGIVSADQADWDDNIHDAPRVDPYRLAARLVEVGMWERRQGGYVLHNYLDYQPSRAEIEAQRKVKSDAGKLGGRRSGVTRGSKLEAEPKQKGSTPEADDEAQVKQNGSTVLGVELPRLLPGRLNPDPDTDTSKVKTLAPASADATKRPRSPDPLWDALLAACGIDEAPTASARGAYNRARKDLADVGAEPAEVYLRAGIFRRRWPGVSLTPNALAKQWAMCAVEPASAANGRPSTNVDRSIANILEDRNDPRRGGQDSGGPGNRLAPTRALEAGA